MSLYRPEIHLVNGPNLNLLGRRQPEIYGSQSFEHFLPELEARFEHLSLVYFQSNHEGELLDYLQALAYREEIWGVVLNAGAYTHTSIALGDALAALPLSVVEVHLSNIYAREDFRRHSYLSPHCLGCITGFGLEGYALAIQYLLHRQSSEQVLQPSEE